MKRVGLVLALLALGGACSNSTTAPSTTPTVTSVSPATITASASPQTIIVTGTNFAAGLTAVITPIVGTVSGAAISNVTSTSFQVSVTIATAGAYTIVVNSGGQASSAFAFTVQAAPTFTLSGTVRETAPTASVLVSGVTITIQDGSFAGRTATTDTIGAYQIAGLTGSMNVVAAKTGYDTTAASVNLSSGNQTLNFSLNPTAQTLDETFTGTINGGSDTCSDGTLTKACSIVILAIHNTGLVDATLTWTGGISSADLDLSLWRGSTVLLAKSATATATEHVSATATSGSNYELHVTYSTGSVPVTYTLRVTHPK